MASTYFYKKNPSTSNSIVLFQNGGKLKIADPPPQPPPPPPASNPDAASKAAAANPQMEMSKKLKKGKSQTESVV